jgi:formylglycine-generating enzyme required for sulfatase activity
MAGNVWEWTADKYVEDYKDLHSKRKEEKETRFQVIRGGSWHSGSSCCRVYFRNALPPNWVDFAVGFRCVKDFKQ